MDEEKLKKQAQWKTRAKENGYLPEDEVKEMWEVFAKANTKGMMIQKTSSLSK